MIVECHAKAAPLIATIEGVDKVCIAGNDRPDFDVQAPIFSLPHILDDENITLNDNGDSGPYITASASHSVNLPPSGGLQIRTGLCWSPDVVRRGTEDRSCSLDQMMALLAVPGITAFSLQGGERAGDINSSSCPALITDLEPQIKNTADLADAISQLDLVICVDSVTAHVAGAMGKPTWVLLPFVSDWRWHTGHPATENSAWYPSMRIFRQSRPGDWSGVIKEVQGALSKRAAGKLKT